MGAFFIVVLFFVSVLNKPNDGTNSYDNDRIKRELNVLNNNNNNNNGQNPSGRINIFTYVEPEPCNGCPGEMGQAVRLTVI